MKLFRNSFLGVAIVAATLTQTIAAPLALLKVRSYADLTNAVTQFATNLNPAVSMDYGKQVSQALGMTDLAGLDTKQPWEVAVWYEMGSPQPLVAIKVPVANVTRFKEGLSSEGFFLRQGREWTQLKNGMALITLKETKSLTESEQTALNQWKGEAVNPPSRKVELTVSLSPSLRTQLSAMMGIARMSLSQAMSSMQSAAPAGLNPKAMEEVFNVYFEMINTFIAGFQELKFGLDLNATTLTVDEWITAQPGSELAQWLQKSANPLTTQDMNSIDPKAIFSMAGSVGRSPNMMQILQRLTMLGFQMQNMATNDAAVKETSDLIAKMLPMKLSASVYLQEQLAFVGTYRFPAGNVTDIYSSLKYYVTHGLQTQVGKDKMYSAATLVEKQQTIDGLPVDRLAITMNMENELFKMPGQKEQLEAFWPGGKMEFDYAVKDGQLLFASAGRMKDLLASSSGKANPSAAWKLEEGTCAAGFLNILGMVNRIIASNPMIPAEVKTKLSQLDSQGTGVEFQLSLDNQLHSIGRVPMKLIRELGRLRSN